MSLISQNVSSRKRTKTKLEEGDKALLLEENKDVEALEMSRQKKIKKEKEKRLEMEQEMKKLESLLFGSLYAPVEFGKEDAQEEVENGTAGFFVDHSANGALSVNEEDAQLFEESDDGEKTLQKKSVWVDDEEEKTNINIANVNRLRKLRKEEDERVISGPEYVSRLRAQHVKLNPGTEWARLDSCSRDNDSYDDESSDEAWKLLKFPLILVRLHLWVMKGVFCWFHQKQRS